MWGEQNLVTVTVLVTTVVATTTVLPLFLSISLSLSLAPLLSLSLSLSLSRSLARSLTFSPSLSHECDINAAPRVCVVARTRPDDSDGPGDDRGRDRHGAPPVGICLGPYGGPKGGGSFLRARYPYRTVWRGQDLVTVTALVTTVVATTVTNIHLSPTSISSPTKKNPSSGNKRTVWGGQDLATVTVVVTTVVATWLRVEGLGLRVEG